MAGCLFALPEGEKDRGTQAPAIPPNEEHRDWRGRCSQGGRQSVRHRRDAVLDGEERTRGCRRLHERPPRPGGIPANRQGETTPTLAQVVFYKLPAPCLRGEGRLSTMARIPRSSIRGRPGT